jgi:hypothetical protein
MELLLFLLLVLLLDLAAFTWGVDNREGRDRPERERRGDVPLTARTQ